MRWLTQIQVPGISLTGQQVDQFEQYEALLLAWNQRVNLTAVRDPAQIRQRHFVDSLTCVSVMRELNGRSVIDVGSGAGFPGLPLKILFPQMRLTLVESVQKKARFLEAVVASLQLQYVAVVVERAEKLGQQPAYREQFDWAVARAVAEMRVLVEYLLPLCRLGGSMLAQKGSHVAAEVAAAHNAINLLGGGEVGLHPASWPPYEAPGYLVVIPKIEATPAKFPRRVGIPAKRPL